MINIRNVAGALLLGLLGTLSVHAESLDWKNWQELYYKSRAEKETDPATALSLRSSPLQVKEVEVSATLPDYPHVRVSEFRGYLREKCVTCHIGISEVSASHPRNFGCTVCHGGDGSTVDRESAHATLIYDPRAGTGKRNPSSLSVAGKTCGQFACHAGHLQADRNHIQRVNKSIMATLAGVISGLRFQWGAQAKPSSMFGVRSVSDSDGNVPLREGALSRLNALPFFLAKFRDESRFPQTNSDKSAVSGHIADNLLRQKCFQCHLDSPGLPGEYRSQGCAACHFTYSADGLYRGDDPTLSGTGPGHPAFHRMTALPPSSTCIQCHKSFSLSPPPAPASGDEGIAEKAAVSFPGKGKAQPDVHFAAGFDCVDCHTQFDIMGDGNIYSKQNQAVEIRCETCHGDRRARPSIAQISDWKDRAVRLSRYYTGWQNSVGDWMAVSARNRKLTNVKVLDGEIVTLGKRTGIKHATPLVRDAETAHTIPQHAAKLECTACHSQWVPVCSGCHTIYDQSRKEPEDKSKPGNFWSPARFSLNIGEPRLMVGPRGKVAPMLPQTKWTLTVLDEQGNPVTALGEDGDSLGPYKDWEFTNPHGYSGANLAYALNPHSIGKQVRSCASCHLNPQALGLGEGNLKIGRHASGKNDKMESLFRSYIIAENSDTAPDAMVTPRGEAVAGSGPSGARPLNQREIVRILKVGNCIPCHDRYEDPIYQNIRKSYAFERTMGHRRLRNNILNSR